MVGTFHYQNNMELRNYQTKAITLARELLSTGKTAVLIGPTGAGKTVIFSTMAKMALAKNKRVLVLMNRRQLVVQTSTTFASLGIKHSIIASGYKTEISQCYIASVATYRLRYPDGFPVDLMIIDEAHLSEFDKVVKAQINSTKIVAVTATPWRANKIASMASVYGIDRNKQFAKTQELIDAGYLLTPRYFHLDTNLDGLVKSKGEYTEASQNTVFANHASLTRVHTTILDRSVGKVVIFCASVQASKDLSQHLNEQGLRYLHVDGTVSDEDRKDVLSKLQNNEIDGITNCAVFTFGFDFPALQTVIINRKTTSLALHHQCIGRGARPYGDQKSFTVIDFGSNLLELGLWEDDVNWNKHYNPNPKKKGDGIAGAKLCPKCQALVSASAKTCKECDYEFKIKVKLERDGEVVAFGRDAPTSFDKLKKYEAAELDRIGKARGYKLGWAAHQVIKKLPPDEAIIALHELCKARGQDDLESTKRYYERLIKYAI